MPVATEVDDLERQIVRLEEEIRRRKVRAEQLRKEIDEARSYVERCKASCVLCLENLTRLKKADLVALDDYRDMLKLYQDNCDLLTQHKIIVSTRVNELKGLLDEQLPFLEAAVIKCRNELKEWGQVIAFRR